MQLEARSYDSSCTAKTAKQFGKLKQSKPEADVAQLVEQPIRKGLSLAYVVVKLGIAEVRFWAF